MAIGKQYKGRLVQMLVSELANEGEKAIKEAYKTRGYTNRLYNLHDSYGSAVYVDGVLDKSTIRYIDPEMSKRPKTIRGKIKIKGREAIADFFQNYSAPRGTICLVVVAAMFYASILEYGEGSLKQKYAVISGAKTSLESVQNIYGGSIERVYIDNRL